MCTHSNIVQKYLDKELKDLSLSYNPTTQRHQPHPSFILRNDIASIIGMSFGINATSLLYNRG